MRLQTCAGLLLGLALSGCATEVIDAPEAIVTNLSNQSVKSISYKPCEQQSQPWTAIEASAIPIGGTFKLNLTEDCVDLQALSANGQLLGTQSGIKRKFPFRWKLF